MVKFTIVIHKPYKEIIKRLEENSKVINRTIYDILTRYGIDNETAIDCANWCELAVVGDSYNTENLDVYIED